MPHNKPRMGKLEVLIMPNDEVICFGKHIGWLTDKVTTLGKIKTLGDYIEYEEEAD